MTTPSITYWNLLEPSLSGDSLLRGLRAQVRDPLWFLCRQWQLGEFQAEDAASPAFVNFSARFAPVDGWRPGHGSMRDYDGHVPLEALSQNEHSTPDLRTAVELGQALEARVAAEGGDAAVIEVLRAVFPVPTVAELNTAEGRDRSLVRLVRVCGGAATHGVAALNAARESAPALPLELTMPGSGLPPGGEAPCLAALDWLIRFTEHTLGPLGREDADGWQPQRLAYDLEAAATTPDGQRVTLAAHAGPFGELDWHAFDEIVRTSGGPVDDKPVVTSLLPTPVRLSGMPDPRWWQFEDARYNWAALDPDRRELGKLLVMDFMLIQSNDWFVVPFGQQVGSLVQIDQLLVRDVFGDWTKVDRADAGTGTGVGSWSMFSIASDVLDDGRAPYFLLPPGALRATVDGPDLEEVRFLRDEQANMVWAVEAVTEDGTGRPWQGRERAADVPDEEQEPTEALRYRLQTTVPVNWIPFVPVQIDNTRRAVALERAAMRRFLDWRVVDIEPVGRVLRPTNVDDPAVYRVREEEVPRSGTRVLRADRRARWIDGTTHLWTSRRRTAGTGEATSGLRYDVVDE